MAKKGVPTDLNMYVFDRVATREGGFIHDLRSTEVAHMRRIMNAGYITEAPGAKRGYWIVTPEGSEALVRYRAKLAAEAAHRELLKGRASSRTTKSDDFDFLYEQIYFALDRLEREHGMDPRRVAVNVAAALERAHEKTGVHASRAGQAKGVARVSVFLDYEGVASRAKDREIMRTAKIEGEGAGHYKGWSRVAWHDLQLSKAKALVKRLRKAYPGTAVSTYPRLRW